MLAELWGSQPSPLEAFLGPLHSLHGGDFQSGPWTGCSADGARRVLWFLAGAKRLEKREGLLLSPSCSERPGSSRAQQRWEWGGLLGTGDTAEGEKITMVASPLPSCSETHTRVKFLEC